MDLHLTLLYFNSYDQAQVALSAIEFSLLPNLPEPQDANRRMCQDLAADIIEYVARCLTSVEGGLYNAEDADSGVSLEQPDKKVGKHANRAWDIWQQSAD